MNANPQVMDDAIRQFEEWAKQDPAQTEPLKRAAPRRAARFDWKKAKARRKMAKASRRRNR